MNANRKRWTNRQTETHTDRQIPRYTDRHNCRRKGIREREREKTEWGREGGGMEVSSPAQPSMLAALPLTSGHATQRPDGFLVCFLRNTHATKPQLPAHSPASPPYTFTTWRRQYYGPHAVDGLLSNCLSLMLLFFLRDCLLKLT